MKYSNYIDSVKNICENAGKIILEIYNTDFSDSIERKEDNSPVTIADKRANNFIVKNLKKLNPNIKIISEESQILEFDKRIKEKYLWIVDPLDGTKEFIKKNDEFTVNIALLEDNKPVLGVVYTPVTNELFWAIKSKGAFSLKKKIVSKLKTNNKKLSSENIRILLSRSHLDEKTILKLKEFNNPSVKYIGSSLKFLIIAEGNADIYFRHTPTMEWDIAASHIILEEAGGAIKNILNNKNIIYNKKSLVNPGFIAIG